MPVQSINSRADLAVNVISYLGLPKYGKMMVGDAGIEFFSDREVADNMVFPWPSIKAIEGKITLSKKVGRPFSIVLQNGRRVRFASKESGKILKLARASLGNDKVIKAPSFHSNIANIAKHLTGRQKKND